MLTAVVCASVSAALGQVAPVELTPSDVGSTAADHFSDFPARSPDLYLPGFDPGTYRRVDFNTAPDGPLSEGLHLTTEYASLGVTMNGIRISAAIYGGNNYGPGFAAEHDAPQVYTFTVPVVAAGIVNTSPDQDFVRFYSGPDGTGTLLLEFRDQEGRGVNYNIDRFLGGVATEGVTIGSFVMSNASGNLELDELIFVVAEPACAADFDGDGTSDVQDLLGFLGAFRTGDPAADINGAEGVTVQDLLAFLGAFRAGC